MTITDINDALYTYRTISCTLDYLLVDFYSKLAYYYLISIRLPENYYEESTIIGILYNF